MWLEPLRSAWPGPCGQVWLSRLGLLEPVGSVTRILVLGTGVSDRTAKVHWVSGRVSGPRGHSEEHLCFSPPLKCHHSDAQQALL